MADSKISDLTARALAALLPTDLIEVLGDPGGVPVDAKVTLDVLRAWAGGMTPATGSDANATMASNTDYTVNMSGWVTSNRTYTLPASPAVGDKVGIKISVGNTTYALIIVGNTSQTINGGSAAAEWSRLFIAGERVVFEYVASNTWVVERNGRIPCVAGAYPSDVTTNSATTHTVAPLANSIDDNAGLLELVTNKRINIRRSGSYLVDFSARHLNVPSANQDWTVSVYKNGSSVVSVQSRSIDATTAQQLATARRLPLAAGDYLQLYFYHGEANKGVRGVASVTWLNVTEVL